MATEDTELTFIRCPKCQSLVPAVATRCRMCGHVFEDADVADDASNDSGGGRVRERALSMSKDQVEDYKGAVSAHAEEDGVGPSGTRAVKPQVAAKVVAQSKNNIGDSVLDLTENNVDIAAVETPFSDEMEGDGPSVKVKEEFSDRVTKKTGKNNSRKGRGKSSGKRREDGRKSPNTADDSDTENKKMEEQSSVRERKPAVKKARKSSSNGQSAAPFSDSVEQGTLFGWFVDYSSDAKGVSHEVRTGQFFIGQQNLRETDMVILEESISTPHCLVRATASDGLVVQDLMSENGTFLKRDGESSYTQHFEPVEVAHGDRLRLGDHQLLVCLLPNVGLDE